MHRFSLEIDEIWREDQAKMHGFSLEILSLRRPRSVIHNNKDFGGPRLGRLRRDGGLESLEDLEGM